MVTANTISFLKAPTTCDFTLFYFHATSQYCEFNAHRCHIWRTLTPSVHCPGSGACSCSTSRAWWPGAAAPRWTDSPPWRTSRTTPPPSSGCAGQHYITPFLALLIYGFNFSNILWFDRNPGWQVTINLHWSMMMAFYEKLGHSMYC